MSDMARAYKSLAQTQRAVTDGGDTVILDGNKIQSPLVEEITFDETVLAGGVGESGGFRVQIPMSEVAQRPARGLTCEVNGNELDVLSVVERNRTTWELTCGETAVEDT